MATRAPEPFEGTFDADTVEYRRAVREFRAGPGADQPDQGVVQTVQTRIWGPPGRTQTGPDRVFGPGPGQFGL